MMNLSSRTRRDFSVGLAAMLPVLGLAKNAVSLADAQAEREGISRTRVS
jgi:hypothetical protein